ncbi:hydrolase [Larsenimonas rhizosphaerae]|uniref:Hydrolase n=1 Tax=Larsenimonas rhizosphaerae TaxID=2944682 RepID=A0AA41ZHA5_9GAMM|nr:hydrolase [Larsenimonas rhizosphaerae]MCM2131393.1 hydrolase [Larsenimonas rhizosphaerae]MCX2525242.1 hydrolase [Larsenimonas rhizosphaerae]
MMTLDPATTALILIDLQHGIVNLPLAPRSGAEVVEASRPVADRFREAGACITWVRVGWNETFSNAPSNNVDTPAERPQGGLPDDWSTLMEGLEQPGDLTILKHQWGAFHGTALDTELRRRGIKTLVFGGIATNMGVESSVRAAWEHGYDVVVLDDLTTTFSEDMQAFAIQTILPRLARITSTDQLCLEH